MHDSSSDRRVQVVEVPCTGTIISRSVYSYDRNGEFIRARHYGPRRAAKRPKPAPASAAAARPAPAKRKPAAKERLARGGRQKARRAK